LFRCRRGRPRLAALPAERDGALVFAIVRDSVFDLAGQYAHDMDGVADHVGRAASPLGPLGIVWPRSWEIIADCQGSPIPTFRHEDIFRPAISCLLTHDVTEDRHPVRTAKFTMYFASIKFYVRASLKNGARDLRANLCSEII
jgi:hypothetical protein